MERKIVSSSDGSPTIYVGKLNQHYHSVHGAITESEHIFIRAGLLAMEKREVKILEIGFGTGLNTYLSLTNKPQETQIDYLAIEKYPLLKEEWTVLDYSRGERNYWDTWEKIHSCEWETWNYIAPGFKLHKMLIDLNSFNPPAGQDLVYFDAFSPGSQPDLWRTGIFMKLYNCLNPGGILVTYSVKGTVKTSVKEAGFRIEKLPGPPGKRQILRAFK